MSDATDSTPERLRGHSKFLILLAVALFVAGGASGFYLISSGTVDVNSTLIRSNTLESEQSLKDVAFVPIEPMVVTIADDQRSRQLRFAAEIEVYPQYQDEVSFLMPRIKDTLNGYLRSIKIEHVEDTLALLRIRLHIFHRLDVIVGPNKISDVLVTEFILS